MQAGRSLEPQRTTERGLASLARLKLPPMLPTSQQQEQQNTSTPGSTGMTSLFHLSLHLISITTECDRSMMDKMSCRRANAGAGLHAVALSFRFTSVNQSTATVVLSPPHVVVEKPLTPLPGCMETLMPNPPHV